MSSLSEYKNDYLSYKKTIIGNDYTFQLYPYNESLVGADNASSIDFNDCINTIKALPQYKTTNEFIIVKLDINRTDALCPQTEYEILADDVPVDLSLCNETKLEVKYTITPNTTLINLTLVNEMFSKGIDIFNPNDPFFTDICYAFTTSNNSDIPLKDRRTDIFQDVSLCDTGCEYKSYEPITLEVTCDCDIKEEIILTATSPTKEFFSSMLDKTNLKIVICYRLLFSIDNYINNIGFLLYACVLIIMTLLFIFFCCNFDDLLFTELYQNVKCSPSTKLTFNIAIKTRDLESTERELNEKYSEKSIKNKEDYKEEDEEDIDYNNSPYSLSLRRDHRTILQIFKDYFIFKMDLINVLFFPSRYEFLCITLSLYLFCLILDCTFNSILFSDDVISSNYHNGGSMNFALTYSLSILSSILGSLCSYVFVRLSSHSSYFVIIEEEIKNQIEYIKICKDILHTIKKRLYLFYILEMVLFLSFWYYITIFCIVYKCSQLKWIIDCFTGICNGILYTIIIALIATLIRSSAIYCQSKQMYYVARYLIYEI